MRPYDELKNVVLPEVKDREMLAETLEAAIGATSSPGVRLALLDADIDHFLPFYDRYGPEQRHVVLANVFDYFRALADAGEIEYVDRLELDQFLLLGTPQHGFAERIRAEIGALRFPLAKQELPPFTAPDGWNIHPDRVTVHIGELQFVAQPSLDYRRLIERLADLTLDAKQAGVLHADFP